MKAVILARVSTEEQKDAGNSLPAQIDRIEAYCKRKEFVVAVTFSFDESAYKTKRDEFDKIIDCINIALSNQSYRRRNSIKISDLYLPLSQKISLSNLENLLSYKKFRANCVKALKKLDYL